MSKAIVIVAPSGTGKSTLIKRLKQKFPQIKESVSYTTRSKRIGEENGVNYFFIDEQEFEKRKENKEFLEWAVVHSHFYGTSKAVVEEGLDRGDILLFDLDVQGADSMKDQFGDRAFAIFIEPPSIEALKERLLSRGTEPLEVIEERIENARKELLRKNDYDDIVVNDDIEQAYQRLYQIFSEVVGGHG